MDWFYATLAEHLVIKDVVCLEPGTVIDYLSMRLTLAEDGILRIDNEEKIIEFLEAKGMSNCNSAQTPLTKEMLTRACTVDNEPLADEEITTYQQDIGRFNWLVQTTHPVLATAVSIASSFNRQPTKGCIEMVKHIYRYLQHAKSLCLERDPAVMPELKVWSDADWAGLFQAIGDPRSRAGIIITYGGMPVWWMSQWQKCKGTTCKADGQPYSMGKAGLIEAETDDDAGTDIIAMASAESEVHAMSDGLRWGLHVKHIGGEFGIPMPDVLQIYVDATAAIGFARGTSGTTRMKHLDLRAAWIQQLRDTSLADFVKVDGNMNEADFFTKLLPRIKFKEHEAKLMSKLPSDHGGLHK